MPEAVKFFFGSLGVHAKIEKPLLLSKVKGKAVLVFVQELSKQLKTSQSFYLQQARLSIQMEVRSLKGKCIGIA